MAVRANHGLVEIRTGRLVPLRGTCGLDVPVVLADDHPERTRVGILASPSNRSIRAHFSAEKGVHPQRPAPK
jgi:hypothetical protein